MQQKQLFVDVETTGRSPRYNSIWQIGLVIAIDGNIVEEKEITCQPVDFNTSPGDESRKNIDEEALKVCGMSALDLKDLMPAHMAFLEVNNTFSRFVDKYDRMDKFFVYGYNVQFDIDFLRQWFLDHDNKYFGSWFFTPPIDIMALAAEAMKSRRHRMPNFKQGTVANTLGIELETNKLHSALYDIQLGYQIYQKVKGGLNEKENVVNSTGNASATVQHPSN